MKGSTGKGDRSRRLIAHASEEAKRFLVMFLYLWVLFSAFVLHERIILHASGISYHWHGFALINAFVLAKVMLVAEKLDLGRWLPRRPLVYRILYDSSLLTLLFVGFHIVEREIVGLIHGKTLASGFPAVGGGGTEGYLSVALILFVALIPFFAFRRVAIEIGPGRLKAMLLAADKADGIR